MDQAFPRNASWERVQETTWKRGMRAPTIVLRNCAIGKGNSVFWEELRLYWGPPQQLTKMYNFIICIYMSLVTSFLGQTSSLGLNIPFFLATFVTYFIFLQPPLIFSLPHKRSLRSNNLNDENKILPTVTTLFTSFISPPILLKYMTTLAVSIS